MTSSLFSQPNNSIPANPLSKPSSPKFSADKPLVNFINNSWKYISPSFSLVNSKMYSIAFPLSLGNLPILFLAIPLSSGIGVPSPLFQSKELKKSEVA